MSPSPVLSGLITVYNSVNEKIGTCEWKSSEIRLGSGPKADILLKSPYVQDIHCKLTRLPNGRVKLYNEVASNKTLVNNTLVQNSCYLPHNSSIAIGSQKLVFRYPCGSPWIYSQTPQPIKFSHLPRVVPESKDIVPRSPLVEKKRLNITPVKPIMKAIQLGTKQRYAPTPPRPKDKSVNVRISKYGPNVSIYGTPNQSSTPFLERNLSSRNDFNSPCAKENDKSLYFDVVDDSELSGNPSMLGKKSIIVKYDRLSKQVTFGPTLSPEEFDKKKPPSTPIKKGSNPESKPVRKFLLVKGKSNELVEVTGNTQNIKSQDDCIEIKDTEENKGDSISPVKQSRVSRKKSLFVRTTITRSKSADFSSNKENLNFRRGSLSTKIPDTDRIAMDIRSRMKNGKNSLNDSLVMNCSSTKTFNSSRSRFSSNRSSAVVKNENSIPEKSYMKDTCASLSRSRSSSRKSSSISNRNSLSKRTSRLLSPLAVKNYQVEEADISKKDSDAHKSSQKKSVQGKKSIPLTSPNCSILEIDDTEEPKIISTKSDFDSPNVEMERYSRRSIDESSRRVTASPVQALFQKSISRISSVSRQKSPSFQKEISAGFKLRQSNSSGSNKKSKTSISSTQVPLSPNSRISSSGRISKSPSYMDESIYDLGKPKKSIVNQSFEDLVESSCEIIQSSRISSVRSSSVRKSAEKSKDRSSNSKKNLNISHRSEDTHENDLNIGEGSHEMNDSEIIKYNSIRSMNRKSRNTTKKSKISAAKDRKSPKRIEESPNVSVSNKSLKLKSPRRPAAKDMKSPRRSAAKDMKSPERVEESPNVSVSNKSLKLRSPERVEESPNVSVSNKSLKSSRRSAAKDMKSPERIEESPNVSVANKSLKSRRRSAAKDMKSPERVEESPNVSVSNKSLKSPRRSAAKDMKSPERIEESPNVSVSNKSLKSPRRSAPKDMKSPERVEESPNVSVSNKSLKSPRSSAAKDMKSRRRSAAKDMKSPERVEESPNVSVANQSLRSKTPRRFIKQSLTVVESNQVSSPEQDENSQTRSVSSLLTNLAIKRKSIPLDDKSSKNKPKTPRKASRKNDQKIEEEVQTTSKRVRKPTQKALMQEDEIETKTKRTTRTRTKNSNKTTEDGTQDDTPKPTVKKSVPVKMKSPTREEDVAPKATRRTRKSPEQELSSSDEKVGKKRTTNSRQVTTKKSKVETEEADDLPKKPVTKAKKSTKSASQSSPEEPSSTSDNRTRSRRTAAENTDGVSSTSTVTSSRTRAKKTQESVAAEPTLVESSSSKKNKRKVIEDASANSVEVKLTRSKRTKIEENPAKVTSSRTKKSDAKSSKSEVQPEVDSTPRRSKRSGESSEPEKPATKRSTRRK